MVSDGIHRRAPFLWGVLLLLGANACPAEEVELGIRLPVAGRRVCFQVGGPPGSPFAILVSPSRKGSVLPSGRIFALGLTHPDQNVLHVGRLDGGGRGEYEMELPLDRPTWPGKYFVQAVAFPRGALDSHVVVSPLLCLEKGPPPRVVPATDSRGWYAAVYLLPLLGLALAPLARRRPKILALLPAAALITLVLHPGPIRRPIARFSAHGFDSGAARRHLSATGLHRALWSAVRLVPKRATVVIPARHAVNVGAALYTSYILAPRRVQYGDPARLVSSAPDADAPLYYITCDPEALPSTVHGEPVPGFSVADFRLYRLPRP